MRLNERKCNELYSWDETRWNVMRFDNIDDKLNWWDVMQWNETRTLMHFCEHFMLYLYIFSVAYILSTKDTQQAKQAQLRLQLTSSPYFCSVTGSIRPSKHKSATTSNKSFLFRSQYRLLLFALIYPGNICQAHMLSFINTLLHTYKVTHIPTWQLPSATTVF